MIAVEAAAVVGKLVGGKVGEGVGGAEGKKSKAVIELNDRTVTLSAVNYVNQTL